MLFTSDYKYGRTNARALIEAMLLWIKVVKNNFKFMTVCWKKKKEKKVPLAQCDKFMWVIAAILWFQLGFQCRRRT